MKNCCQSTFSDTLTEAHKINCELCSMNAICKPLSVNSARLDLADEYLSKQLSIKAGHVLFESNEETSSIYAICAGTFKLSHFVDGKEKVVGFRFPGELLGEDALFEKHYNYQVSAITDGAICKVSVEKLTLYSEMVPNLQQNLIELLSKQHLFNFKTFQSLVAKHSAESLLAAFILNIFDRGKLYYGSDNHIFLPMSRDSIANFLGLRRETLSRLFSKFQKQAYITVSAKKITLLDRSKLHYLANL
jgi:CRP/FNR family transcriptional regulator